MISKISKILLEFGFIGTDCLSVYSPFERGKAFKSSCGSHSEGNAMSLIVGKANVRICSDCDAACAEVISKESEEKSEN